MTLRVLADHINEMWKNQEQGHDDELIRLRNTVDSMIVR